MSSPRIFLRRVLRAFLLAALAVSLTVLPSVQAQVFEVASPAAQKAEGEKPAGETKPGEKTSDEKKPGEKKDGEQKPDEEKKADKPASVKRPTEPKQKPDPKELTITPGEDGRMAFSFRGQPWPQVLQWLADASNFSLDWQELPADYLNLVTEKRYSLAEARNLFNHLLLDRGYTMVLQGQCPFGFQNRQARAKSAATNRR